MAGSPRTPKADAPYPPGWEPFLAAINAHLDEDTPRLVFADWLQENGDEERAEFIRIQCELHRVHPQWDNPAIQKHPFMAVHRAARERQNELRIANFNRWTDSFSEWAKASTWAFRRGFPYFFVPTALQWLKDGEHVRRQTAVESLTITHTNPRSRSPWEKLLAMPSVVGLSRLYLPDIDSDGVRALADSSALDSLRELQIGKIGRYGIGPDAASALIASPRLANLRSLSVVSNWLGKPVATALATTPHIRELEELRVPCTSLQSREFATLIASPKVERLRVLNLQGNAIGDKGVRALVESNVKGLEELNLRYNGLTAESARLLAAWPGLRSVRILELAGGHFGPDGVRDFLASEFLTSMEILELPSRDIRKRDKTEFEALPAYQRISYVRFAS